MAFDLIVGRSKIFDDVFTFQPSVNYDRRGSIFTTYSKEHYQKYLPENIVFIHDKFAESKPNVLRGMHGDSKTWKLVTCIKGDIFQVIVDYRPDSPTYLKWESWHLNDQNKVQVLVPPSFLNGYYVIGEKEAIYHYKLAYAGEYIDAAAQVVLKWNDDRLKIDWPCTEPILQARDQ
ncbi:MAG: dTDP-4-dehydrorhamnose 3,5-epimerase family protein [Leptospiraceae bacterium]|nr:dTDP-4-dehydrorhamnose 3,5-epimerase family protein [candidate division KSB1 bacterium]MCP5498220.1 dTDP-4-dehydrorhamnose 3,5-epimerase family protein [Leptospiraceae bacterium]